VTVLHPCSLAEAAAMLLDDPQALPLGGGTAIQILRKQGLLSPSALVDLSGLPELRGIDQDGAFLRIGAMATHREVELSPIVRAVAPVLCQTYRHVSNVRVRHTATVGGNLAHGDYRLDPPAALLVLDSAVVIAGPAGQRVIPLREFFVDVLETVLEPGELIVEIRVPIAHPRRSAQFVKFSSLGANDWPCVGACASLEWDDSDRLAAARLGVTAMAPVPLLARLDDVAGLSEAAVSEAAMDVVLDLVDPIPDIRGSVEYKRRVCAATVRDAISAAWSGEKEAERP
jgi:aerobic carbon-monoxide dehydrogenase medium subunit